MSERRVVVTGLGLVCPLGLSADAFWTALDQGTSGVVPIESFSPAGLPLRHAAEARCFTGAIGDFGELDGKRRRRSARGSR